METCNKIYIESTDTDVCILLIYFAHKWRSSQKILLMKNGLECLNIIEIAGKLGAKSDCLLGIHALSKEF